MTLLPAAGPSRRLTGAQANHAASRLEAAGRRAEGINLVQGGGLVEVRAARVRGRPRVATLRTVADVEAFVRAWPGCWPPGPRLSPEDWQRCRAAALGLGGVGTPTPTPHLPPPVDATAGRDGGAAGQELRRRREALGLGQRAAAARLGVSRSYLCEIERGRLDGPGAQEIAAAGLTALSPEGGER
jgi:Helix-turn-helix domain